MNRSAESVPPSPSAATGPMGNQSSAGPPRRAGGHWWRFVLLILLPFALYLPGVTGQFAIDDYRFIARNEHNLALLASAPLRFFTDPSTNSVEGDGDIYRPLRTFFFAVDHACFGLDPLPYHLHSMALHTLVVVLLYLLLRRTLEPTAGFLAALLFAVHPLCTEAVAWISGRSDLEAAVCVLAALLFARRAESGRGLLAPLLVAALAGLAKETAVMLPGLYLVEHRLREGHLGRRAALPFALLCAGVIVYLAIYVSVRQRGIVGQVDFYGGDFLHHLPFGLIGLARMLRLTLLPTGLNYYHEPALFLPLRAIDVALAVTGLLIALLLAVVCRRRSPAVTWGIAWFFLAIVPAANVILPLRTVLAERFAYLPLIGIVLALAALLLRVTRAARPAVGWSLLALVVAAAGTATAARAAQWRTNESLYRATLRHWPRSYSASLGLAVTLAQQGRTDAALAAYRRAAELAPALPQKLDAWYGLGHTALLAGDAAGGVAPLQQIDRQLDGDRSLIPLMRHAAEARYDLACCLAALQRYDLAAQVLDRLLDQHGRDNPEWLDARGEIARAQASITCLDYYDEALRLDPDYHRARIHTAEVLLEMPSLVGEARRQLKEVLARDPGNERAAQLLEKLRRGE